MFKIDDGVVPRFGVEFVDPNVAGGRLAVRGGYLRMPDDRIRLSRFNSTDPDINDAYRSAFRGGDEVDYVTAGVGYTIGRSSIQIGGAFSDEETQVIGSYTFKLEQE